MILYVFYEKGGKLKHNFLNLSEVSDSSGLELKKLIIDVLKSLNIKYKKKLKFFFTDGARNNTGVNNGCATLMKKEEILDLILGLCGQHNFQNGLKDTWKNIEKLKNIEKYISLKLLKISIFFNIHKFFRIYHVLLYN